MFVVFDGVKMLDVAGPAEVFTEASLLGAGYTLGYVSPSGRPVRTSVGILLPVDGTTEDVRHPDTVVVPGADTLVGQPDALFVEDDGVFTSAGVSAGIDLALALVERDHGPDLARDVARSLVMFMQRPGGQSQFSTPLQVRPPRTPVLRDLVDVISAQPSLDHSAGSLASRAGVSPRHLARLFATELHTTPAISPPAAGSASEKGRADARCHLVPR